MTNSFDIYRRLFGFLRPYRKEVLIAYVSVLFAAGLNLIVPQILKNAIDSGLDSGEATALFWAGGMILAIAIVRGAAAFAQRYYGEWITHRIAYDLRNRFYSILQRLPFACHDQAQTGDLMSRATGDITESERFIGIGLMDLTATVFLMVGVIVAMFLESVQLALYALGPMLILIYATVRFGGIVRPRFKLIQEQMGLLSSVMQESLTGIGVVKAFAREPHEM